MQLFEKIVSPSGRVSYKPYTENLELQSDLTEKQIISSVGALAVCAIHGYRTLVRPKSAVDNRIQRVQDSVLSMYTGTGAHIDDDAVTHVCHVWDRVMLTLDGERSSND